ncbi:MAG: butyrate kinase [Erysipelotrichales bacterium]|nr:butyrate kinase [Erysipelotrichales bacterium]
MKKYRIFVINPGSTSTKLSLHENTRTLFETDVFHDSSVLKQFPTINDQLSYRMEVVENFLRDNNIDLTGIDAIVGRGGGCYSVEGGIYTIDERLIDDTKNARGGLYHSSMLGVQMADLLHKKYGGIAISADPPVVDELDLIARITGIKGIYRHAICHALNLKETARRHAEAIGKPYEECDFIVCHIDGGISVTAHHHGRMIDGNNAGGGEGPFTPTRMGSMAVTDVLEHLYGEPYEKLRSYCSQTGGLSSHFGTSDSDKIHKMIEDGDEYAKLVWDAMIYQVCKSIGSMMPVLKGHADAIVLTGGLLRFPEIEETIRDRCGFIAPVVSYPGEFEHEAMARAGYEVLTGKVTPKTYPGKPVFNPSTIKPSSK